MYTILALSLLAPQEPPKKGDVPDYRERITKEYGLESHVNDSAVRKLQKERCIERGVAILKMRDVIAIGRWEPAYMADYLKLHVTFAQNLTELAGTPADKLRYAEMSLANLKEVEEFATKRLMVGVDPGWPHLIHMAKAARIDAEIEVLKMKGGK